jgi:predicted nucleotide-binding protein (sugar kinase/HSP70/actin superfamily)
MKNYYCIIVIGDNKNTQEILSKVINGKFNTLDLNKIFVSTFESDHNIWEIEKFLFENKKSFFLSKMDGENFTATIQDAKIQNDLFLDYVQKMISLNNRELNEIDFQNFEIIDEEPPKDFFDFDPNYDEIKSELDEIKKNASKYKNKGRKELSLDELLDKINDVGYDKLTDFEKDTLKTYSETK